jgi:hypothetical protein
VGWGCTRVLCVVVSCFERTKIFSLPAVVIECDEDFVAGPRFSWEFYCVCGTFHGFYTVLLPQVSLRRTTRIDVD